MNRVIKFRGFGPERDGWVYGYYYSFGDRTFIIEPGRPGIPEQHIEVYPESVGQFTGLFSKDEAEIYEGDIVKYRHIDNIPYRKATIRNLDGTTDLHIDTTDGYIYGLMTNRLQFPLNESEVIGNTYENPELLKQW